MFKLFTGGKKTTTEAPPITISNQVVSNTPTPEETKLISLIVSTNEQLTQAMASINNRPSKKIILMGSSSEQKMVTGLQSNPLTEQERIHFLETIKDVLRKLAEEEWSKVAEKTKSLRIKIGGVVTTVKFAENNNKILLEDLAQLVNKSLDEDPSVPQNIKDKINGLLIHWKITGHIAKLTAVFTIYSIVKPYGTDEKQAEKVIVACMSFLSAVTLGLDLINRLKILLHIAINLEKFAKLLHTSISSPIEATFRHTLPADTRIEILDRMALYPLNPEFYVGKQEIASIDFKLDQIRAEKIRQMESGSDGLQSVRPETSSEEVELWKQKIAAMETLQKMFFSEMLVELRLSIGSYGNSSTQIGKLKKAIQDTNEEIDVKNLLRSDLSNEEKVAMAEEKVRLLYQRETLLLKLERNSAASIKGAKSRFEEEADVYRRFLIFAGLIGNSPLSSFEKCDWDCMSFIVDEAESLPEAQFIWSTLESRRKGQDLRMGVLRKKLVDECVQYCRKDKEYLNQAVRFFEGINAARLYCFNSIVGMKEIENKFGIKEKKDKQNTNFSIEGILTKCQGKPLAHYEIMTSLFRTGIPEEEREELISLVASIPIPVVESVQEQISDKLESGKRWADIKPIVQSAISKNPIAVNTRPLDELIRLCRKPFVVDKEESEEGLSTEEESDDSIEWGNFQGSFAEEERKGVYKPLGVEEGTSSPDTKGETPTEHFLNVETETTLAQNTKKAPFHHPFEEEVERIAMELKPGTPTEKVQGRDAVITPVRNVERKAIDHPFAEEIRQNAVENNFGIPTNISPHQEFMTSAASFKIEQLLSKLSNYEIEKLKILGSADVSTLSFLREFGTMEAQAKAEFDFIQKDPLLYEYYATFSRILSSTLRANQVIDSGFVADGRQTLAEQAVSALHTAAQSSNVPFLTMATAGVQFFLGTYEGRERTIRVHKIAQSFPIEKIWVGLVDALALKITLVQQEQIREKPISNTSSIKEFFEYIEKTLGWLSADDINTSTKKLAATHVTKLLNRIMKLETAVIFEKEHLPQLIAMATGRKLEEISIEFSTSQKTDRLTSVSTKNDSQVTSFKESIDLDSIKELERKVNAQSKQLKELEKHLPKPTGPLGAGGLVLASLPGTTGEISSSDRIRMEQTLAELQKQVGLLTDVVMLAGLGNTDTEK